MIPDELKEHESYRNHSVHTIGWVMALTLIGTAIGLEWRRRQQNKDERGHIWEGDKSQETPKN